MCVIALKPVDKVVTKRELKNCFSNNSNGAGMMYSVRENGENLLCVDKGYFGFRKFYKHFRMMEALYPDSPFILHFRIATSGYISADACHPFMIHDDLAFVHNGIFSKMGSIKESDTQEFNRTILRRLPKNFLDIEKAKNMVNEYITTSLSKVVFMDNVGNYTIMNESAGIWNDKGVWFSNTGYSYNVSESYMREYYGGYSGYDTSGASYTTVKKRCIVCSCWAALANVEWEDIIFEGSKQTGWVCKFCRDFMANTHKCSTCGESKPRSKLYRSVYGEFVCDVCTLMNGDTTVENWEAEVKYLKEAETGDPHQPDTITGVCPVCCMTVTAVEKDNWACPQCGIYLSRNDYLENVI